MNTEPVPERDGIQLERKWGVGLLGALVAAAVLISVLAGNPLGDFFDQVSEAGFWQAFVDGVSLGGALGLLFESALGAGLTVYAVGKFLGRSPGEWFVDFLLFILAWLAAVIAELLALLALTVTGPLLILLIFLILLASLVAILIAAITFLKPLIVAGVNWICAWILWYEPILLRFVQWLWEKIIEWKEFLERQVQRVERWEQRTRTEYRRVRTRTCATWHWLISWLCVIYTYVVELIAFVVKWVVKVVVWVVKWVTVIVMVIIWVIIRVIVWLLIWVPKLIFFCWLV